ncbi:hypothetical protein Enr17x_23600 [Gimesia fumaroli]|uniref:Uncharacterized protein n=1 Tax=Gimesia fumaroli TaxID=2527976 RepID=A0A518IB91_9PLAN|nr:hypothetical protein Enr17x_23600 [Gimesia fumaroli]
MRENRTSGSEGGGTGSNRSFLPLSILLVWGDLSFTVGQANGATRVWIFITDLLLRKTRKETKNIQDRIVSNVIRDCHRQQEVAERTRPISELVSQHQRRVRTHVSARLARLELDHACKGRRFDVQATTHRRHQPRGSSHGTTPCICS